MTWQFTLPPVFSLEVFFLLYLSFFFKVRTTGHCEDYIHNQLLEHFLAWHMVKASAATNSTLLFLPATSHSVFSGRDFS